MSEDNIVSSGLTDMQYESKRQKNSPESTSTKKGQIDRNHLYTKKSRTLKKKKTKENKTKDSKKKALSIKNNKPKVRGQDTKKKKYPR
jgi:hypothetical protein